MTRTRFGCLLLVAATLVGWGAAWAEVSVIPQQGRRVATLVMDLTAQSITDGADPIPRVDPRWRAYRREFRVLLLNPEGDLRMDGPPEIVFYPDLGWPFVVWAWNNGTDHDIAYAQWTGTGWSDIRFLTASREDEIDPRAYVDANGTIHVVWWVNSNTPHVRLVRGRLGEAWSPSYRVTSDQEIARRPSVVSVGASAWVAYEQTRLASPDAPDAQNSRTIAIGRFGGSEGAFTQVHSVPVPGELPADPVLHLEHNRLWLDWRHAPGVFGWTRLSAAGITEESFVPWADPSWVGVESVRLVIRRRVLNQPALGGDLSTLADD